MKRRPNIGLIAASAATIGGHSVQARALEAQLSARGYDVSYIPIDIRLPRWLRQIRYLRTIVNEVLYLLTLHRLHRCDVVHVFSASYWSFLLAPAPAVVAGRLLRKKVILHYHSGEADDHLTRWRRIVRPILRLADEIVVPSVYLEKIFSAHGYRTRVIPNVIDESQVRVRERRPLRPRLLSARNLESYYGVDTIIRAFSLLKGRFPEATLTIVGSGSCERSLRSLVDELAVSNVRFLGAIDPASMDAVYDAADIFVNASVIDNQPVSILEAFASGLPVVSTPTGDIASMLGHGKAGLLVDSTDPARFSDAVASLLDDEEASLRLTQCARKNLERHAAATVCEQWRSLYDDLLSAVGCNQEVVVNGV